MPTAQKTSPGESKLDFRSKDQTGSAARKIIDLDALAKLLRDRGGKKVVHCHGVFDLLHIGHIRYFNAAKSHGDILVVTLTPDSFVRKGPDRPAFTENLRAEAIASLDVVDYVAVNRWPTAVETIRVLRPDIYAKGADYKDARQDITGGISLEKKAVESAGGKLVITEEITFSSSRLLNQYFSPFPPETSGYLKDFGKRFALGEIIQILDRIKTLKVGIIGETILDEYVFCEAIGKSSKEPMLALKPTRAEKFAGGVLAVANHVANFCDQVELITCLGSQHRQQDFIESSLSPSIRRHFLTRQNSPTIVKRRFLDNYTLAKMFEIYEMNDDEPHPSDQKDLHNVIKECVGGYDVLICLDYGHGMLTEAAIELLCKNSRFLSLNTQSNAGNFGFHNISKYPRADLICVDEREIKLEVRHRAPNFAKELAHLSRKMKASQVMMTRGKNGSLLYDSENGLCEAPALATQVVDRMGAGDAFLSIVSLGAVLGVSSEILSFLGNVAGAEAVATIGHKRPLNKVGFIKHIEALLK